MDRMPERHNPFQILMLGACALSGTLRLLQMPVNENAVTTMPHTVLVVWYLFLLIGGIIGLISMVVQDVISGLLIERASMWLLAAATGFYVAAFLTTVGPRSSFSLIFVGAFGLACLIRGWKITRAFKSWRKKK